MKKILSLSAGTLLLMFSICQHVDAQTTAFTYQGSLNNGGTPANGNHDFELALFDSLAGGSQLGSTLTRTSVAVSNGVFSVSLDFGSHFPGANRFLEIRVRTSGGGAFTPLTPRQPFTSSPYSIRSLNAEIAANAASATNAANATNSAQLGGVNADQYVQTTDPRMTDARTPTAGSASYIQNQNAGPQPSSSFNISGGGTLGGNLSVNGSVNTNQHYSLDGTPVLRTRSVGATSLYVGPLTGPSAFVGDSNNSYFGSSSGRGTLSATDNSFFGFNTGLVNEFGDFNSYFGASTGVNSTGSNNAFFGAAAGGANTSGSNNTLIGASTDLGSSGLTFSTALGARASVSQSNSLVLGAINGINGATADTNVGVGTTAPARRLHVSSGSSGATSLSSADFVIEDDAAAFQHFLTSDDAESGILFGDPSASIGGGLIFNNAATNNGIQFRAGGNTTRMTLDGSGNLGIGTSTPSDKLDLIGSMRISILGVAGPTPLCRNASNQISLCSSSGRYKSNINSFSSGLSLIHRLRPVSFNWRDGGMLDLGLVAEEVAKVEPLLTSANDEGDIEGVKYDRVAVVLVNAVKEQQAQIEKQDRRAEAQQKLIYEQARTIARQQADIDALKRIVCAGAPSTQICVSNRQEEPKK